jgi:putative CocE/NonD family hydrolase
MRLGIRHDIFREWITHWQHDEYWKQRSIGSRIDKTNVPTLFISGWWDGNGRGAPVFFNGMRHQAREEKVQEKQRLLIGPWDHDLRAPDCDDLPEYEAEFIERGALRDSLNDELAWFDHHLKGIAPGVSTKARVSLYITGIHRWYDFEDWPVPQTTCCDYVLFGGKTLHTGGLQTHQNNTVSDSATYLFDPELPTPFASADIDGERIPFNNADIEKQRDDLLLFDSLPFEKPIAFIGDVEVRLFASADTCDFDLYVKLLDVYPDGRAIYLTDGILRARFRNGFTKASLVPLNTINEYTICLWHIGHVIKSGHLVRIEVASGAFLRFDVNPCTGSDIASDTQSQKARVTIHHDSQHPSRIILPVCHDPRLYE